MFGASGLYEERLSSVLIVARLFMRGGAKLVAVNCFKKSHWLELKLGSRCGALDRANRDGMCDDEKKYSKEQNMLRPIRSPLGHSQPSSTA